MAETPDRGGVARPKPIDLPPDAPPLPGKSGPPDAIRKVILDIKQTRKEFAPVAISVAVPCLAVPVGVRIEEAPVAAIPLSDGAGPGRIDLHAIDLEPPDGGFLTWSIPNNGGSLEAGDLIHSATFSLTATTAGSELVRVQYVYEGVIASDTIWIHVLSVVIVQAPALAVACVAGAETRFSLNANAVPGGAIGVLNWEINDTSVMTYASRRNAQQLDLLVAQPGSTPVRIQYSYLGVTVSASMQATAVSVTIAEAPDLAFPMHDAAAGAAANQRPLNALGNPPGGVYDWATANAGIACFTGGAVTMGDLTQVDILSAAGGSVVVTVGYTYAGVRATAAININICSISIQQAPTSVAVCHSAGNPANRFPLDAVVLPPLAPPGRVVWTVGNASAMARFDAGNDPGSVVGIHLETVSSGVTSATATYSLHGCTIAATVAIQVISVAINPAPEVLIALPAVPVPAPALPGAAAGPPLAAPLPATMPIQAAGNPPGIGNYDWQILAHAAAGGALPVPVRFQGGVAPGNNPAATLETLAVAAGSTCDVEVTYTVGVAVARARIECHVVSAAIQQAAAAPPNPRVLKAFAGVAAWGMAAAAGATTALDAVGAPANCTDGQAGALAWQELTAARARFQGGVAPGAVAQIQVEAVSASPPYTPVLPAQFQVDYALHGVAANATVNVDILPECSQVHWAPAGAAIVPQARVACVHEAGYQHPGAAGIAGPAAAWPIAGQPGTLLPAVTAGGVTPAAVYPHHHGGVCAICSAAQNGLIEHWVDPNIAANAAVADMLELRNQIRSCMQVWEATYLATAGTAPVKRAAADLAVGVWAGAGGQNWPWLVSMPGVPIDFHSLRFAGPGRGKMFGVLRGVMGANAVKLRGNSGTLGGLVQHPYWSHALPARQTIHSATNTNRTYPVPPAANPIGGTFGTCAASKMLTHALHLGIQIDTMAEMWVGNTVGTRVDGELQTSCDNCRRYLGEMLCEIGGNPRSDPYPAPGVGADPNGMPPNFGF